MTNDSARLGQLQVTLENARARAAQLLARSQDLRVRLAESASEVAEQAENMATILEVAAGRSDAKRRLSLAAAEREIAGVERRNAARLLGRGDPPLGLEHVPRLGPPPVVPTAFRPVHFGSEPEG